MFERYTERARQSVVHAQEAAREMRHSQVGTEHLFLGLLVEGEGVAARVLSGQHSEESVRAAILGVSGSGESVIVGQIPFSTRGKAALEGGLREALALGHNYIGTEHILLGVLRDIDDDPLLKAILLAEGWTAEEVREEVIALLSRPIPTHIVPPLPEHLAKSPDWLLLLLRETWGAGYQAGWKAAKA